MKDKLIQFRVDAEFLSKLEYLRLINEFRTTAETIRRIVEKEWRKEQCNLSKWIPCNERLPKENGFYLVTITDGEQIAVCKMPFVGSEWKDNWFGDEVIAWMPLPEPWKMNL